MKKSLTHKATFFFVVAVLYCLFLYYLDIKNNLLDDKDFWKNIIYNAHGLIIDLIVLGMLLSIYEGFASKRNDRKRLEEELTDFEGWKGDEASYRIAGIIRRLQVLGVQNIVYPYFDTMLGIVEKNHYLRVTQSIYTLCSSALMILFTLSCQGQSQSLLLLYKTNNNFGIVEKNY